MEAARHCWVALDLMRALPFIRMEEVAVRSLLEKAGGDGARAWRVFWLKAALAIFLMSLGNEGPVDP